MEIAVRSIKSAAWVAVSLIFLAAVLRLLPHPANFAPVTSVAIFGGATLPRRLSWWVPVTAVMLSDLIIGFYPIMPVIWACYLCITVGSGYVLRQPRTSDIAITILASSGFFFVVTNFAVWLWGGLYEHTWSGLVQCYTMALPFFRNSLLGDVFYTFALFGLFALSRQLVLLMRPPGEMTEKP